MRRLPVDPKGEGDDAAYAEAATRIRNGKLVAFPTETVYGLGANGLDAGAVENIFTMKRRPLDDPVILHVNSIEAALPLWTADAKQLVIIDQLQRSFWPGPLTIIAPASSLVPPVVTAGTGKVAVRCPAHPVARKLIAAAEKPIAAPSANLFSRISPTRAEHVAKYFNSEDLLLLDCGQCCSVGVESTVISIERSTEVHVLRCGHITAQHLRSALSPETAVFDKITLGSVNDSSAKSSPGQSLVHYAPTVPTFLAVGSSTSSVLARDSSKTAILDLSGSFSERSAFYYRSLAGEDHEAMARHLFSTMHDVEDHSGASELIIYIDSEDSKRPEFAAVLDRCIRAAGHRLL